MANKYELILDTRQETAAKEAAAKILAALDHAIITEEKAKSRYHVHFESVQPLNELTFAFESCAKQTAREAGFSITLQMKH